MLLLKARKERFYRPRAPARDCRKSKSQADPELIPRPRFVPAGCMPGAMAGSKCAPRCRRGRGHWPAVWMMPVEDHYGPWPLLRRDRHSRSGQLSGRSARPARAAGARNRTISALHFGDPATRQPVCRQAGQRLPDLALPSQDYHVYAVEWGEGLIRFLVDDRVHLTVAAEGWSTGSPLARGNPAAPFDRPFLCHGQPCRRRAFVGEKTTREGLPKAAFPRNSPSTGSGSIAAQPIPIQGVRAWNRRDGKTQSNGAGGARQSPSGTLPEDAGGLAPDGKSGGQ